MLCDWHSEFGVKERGKYRAQPSSYRVTWPKSPNSNEWIERYFPAARSEEISGLIDRAFSTFESYAGACDDKHPNDKVSAQVLAWLVSRIIRAWPFADHNEELAQLSLQAGALRLNYSAFTLSLDRAVVRHELAYALAPNQPRTVNPFAKRIEENLSPSDGNEKEMADGLAKSLSDSHRAFSKEVASADLDELNAEKPKIAGVPSEVITGGNSRTGRRSRKRWNR